MVPKNFRKNIDITPNKIGVDRRQEWLDSITYKDGLLPRSVSIEDMDSSFIDFTKSDLKISIEGGEVPVIFLTIQRWSEFTKTWKMVDDGKDIKMPFITVVRKPDIQQGTNQAGLWNIPGNRTYTYMKVPTWDGARKGIDLYKIPQPTSVDITYEVRFFCNRLRDLNKLNNLVQRLFQSRQFYISPNGHPMPILLESIGDESVINDFENRRFYVQKYEMKLLGYLLDSDDFEVVPTINRAVTMFEVEEKIDYKNVTFNIVTDKANVKYEFIFKPLSNDMFSFKSEDNVVFNQLTNIENVSRIIIKVNNLVIFDGLVIVNNLVIKQNDVVTIEINNINNNLTSQFNLLGETF